MSQSHLTVGEVATIYGIPDWKIRRLVDSLDIEIQRAASYRLIPRSALAMIAVELQRQGWLPKEEVTPCS